MNTVARSTPARVIAAVLVVILAIHAASYLIGSESFTRYMENKMNRNLKGYTVHIGKAYFHPLSLSLDLRNVILVQQANPEPPVASIVRLHLSVHWGALLNGRLVGDFLIDRPKLYINLNNIRVEKRSEIPIQKKGWQDAVQSIYPLKIDVLRLNNGDVTYIEKGPYRPLRASRVYLSALDIRNIRYPDRVYPSPVRVEGVLFDKGRVSMTGDANFLLEPHFGIKAEMDLKDMDLGYFRPIADRYNITLNKGIASAHGSLEYNPKITEINLEQVELKSLGVDYVHLARTAAIEKERVEKTKQVAKELSNKPEARIRIRNLKMTDGRFGYVNKASNPPYRIFISAVNATMTNFSNHFADGPAEAQLKGKFMGTGDTKASATFRSEAKSPDFDLNLAIIDTDMPAMSDLFKAYGNFEIRQGLFSFFTELTVKNNTINGYVKPLFKNLEVDDRRSEKQKNLFHRTYIAIVKGLARLLENPETRQVATEVTISGPLDGKKTSTGEVIVNLVRNAFVQAILPGFERQLGVKRKSSPSEKKQGGFERPPG
jgi:hypothetical protein